LALVDAVAGGPGVEVGLAEAGGGDAVLVEPAEEVLRGGELPGGVLAGGRPQRPGGGVSAEPGELVPERELAQQLLVRGVRGGGQAVVQPRLEVEQVPVARRRPSAGAAGSGRRSAGARRAAPRG
jgi:hypothetical protein